jgi:glycerate kinase
MWIIFCIFAHEIIKNKDIGIMKKVVIAVDSFKGSLSATEVAETISKTFNDILPECEVVSLPLSDGGEGLTEVLVNRLKGRYHMIDAFDPLMRPIKVQFGAIGRCAIIEMATAAGLTLLSEEERNPMNTTTYGVGVMMQAALDLGYRKFLVGIGGSATNDAGLGAMQALGLRCYNSQGRIIKTPITGSMLNEVTHLDLTNLKRKMADVDLTIACDVQNPLFGPQGAAFVYAPQKGANEEEVQLLDAGLRHISHVWRRCCGVVVEHQPCMGAAGGFGGAFSVLLGAKLRSGIDCVLDALDFDNVVEEADLVITGEGTIDEQSLMGKALTGLLRRSNQAGVPVLAIAGYVEDREALIRAGVSECLESSSRSISQEEAMKPEIARQNIVSVLSNWIKVD